MSETCKKVIEAFYTGTISHYELYHRILEAWDPDTNIREIVEMLKPEQAEGFKRMVEDWLFEGGITVAGGVTNLRRIDGKWCCVKPEPIKPPASPVSALRAFKQYYGFEIPENFGA